MATDNTQAELDEILERYRAAVVGLPSDASVADIKGELLDWHNKQIEAVLDRLATQRGILSDPVHGEKSIPASAIEAEREKLNNPDGDVK